MNEYSTWFFTNQRKYESYIDLCYLHLRRFRKDEAARSSNYFKTNTLLTCLTSAEEIAEPLSHAEDYSAAVYAAMATVALSVILEDAEPDYDNLNKLVSADCYDNVFEALDLIRLIQTLMKVKTVWDVMEAPCRTVTENILIHLGLSAHLPIISRHAFQCGLDSCAMKYSALLQAGGLPVPISLE